LELIDQCLASLPEGDQRIPLLYQLRHRLVEQATSSQQQEVDMKKMQAVIEKLTAPANRIGTLVGQSDEGVARIMVGGAEYYANVDPRIEGDSLKVGHQILVNEAYVVIRSLGYDRSGPIVKVRELLGDGRLRIDQEAGRQGILIQQADDLASVDLKVGDEVRLDPTHRIAIERLENPHSQLHLLAELPTVRWEHIGGQQEAIGAIRRSIEYPLLHEGLFARYQFQQPKGFLLYGPPGCGKTLIGQATAASLGQLLAQNRETSTSPAEAQAQHAASRLPPLEGGLFLYVKGPEVLNMWVGESERIIRDLFLQARQQRQAGKLPFIFIDEAESILGTRRAVRSYNVSNTLVPMFCAELDGIESLSQVVVILASNRPDMIDPAVLRPGRIDRKIKVGRPGRKDAGEILRVYLTADLPYASKDSTGRRGTEDGTPVSQIVEGLLENLFQRSQENRVLAIRLRNGRREILYRRDLLSGAVLAGIVRRAKERAIERAIQAGDRDHSGLTLEDFVISSNEEFKESEIFPPDDSAEEWLKLLDYHPDQVIGVSSLQPGKDEEEHRTSQIV
jgi:proteasome-associated ATPase